MKGNYLSNSLGKVFKSDIGGNMFLYISIHFILSANSL